jgi:hypothetical protein
VKGDGPRDIPPELVTKVKDISVEQIGRHLKILIGIGPRERGRKAEYHDIGR